MCPHNHQGAVAFADSSKGGCSLFLFLSEHWLMSHELAYKYKCIGIYVEIMRVFYDLNDYANVQRFASMALTVDKSSVDAYYWMIRAMRKTDAISMAKGELKMAEHILTDEEYRQLILKLENAEE